jgi:hypothetical protein
MFLNVKFCYEIQHFCFDCPQALDNFSLALPKAIEFELLWLENKKNYYGAIVGEDEERLEILHNLLFG